MKTPIDPNDVHSGYPKPGHEADSAECDVCEWSASGPWSQVAGLAHYEATRHPWHMYRPAPPDPYAEPGLVRWVKEDHTTIVDHQVKAGQRVITIERADPRVNVLARDLSGQVECRFDGYRWYIHEDMLTDVEPMPAVVVPDEPTLGWVTTKHDGECYGPTIAFVGSWDRSPDGMLAGEYNSGYRNLEGTYSGSQFITAFVPATAVEAESLERLRMRYRDRLTYVALVEAVGDFLEAIDKASE